MKPTPAEPPDGTTTRRTASDTTSKVALAVAIVALVLSAGHCVDDSRHCDPDALNGYGHCFREDGRSR